jgi:hypothetical protein
MQLISCPRNPRNPRTTRRVFYRPRTARELSREPMRASMSFSSSLRMLSCFITGRSSDRAIRSSSARVSLASSRISKPASVDCIAPSSLRSLSKSTAPPFVRSRRSSLCSVDERVIVKRALPDPRASRSSWLMVEIIFVIIRSTESAEFFDVPFVAAMITTLPQQQSRQSRPLIRQRRSDDFRCYIREERPECHKPEHLRKGCHSA